MDKQPSTPSSPAPTQGQRMWPTLLVLAAVSALLVMQVVVDVSIARRVTDRTAEIVLDSQRSIELVGDMRLQANRLLRAGADHLALLRVTNQIEADAREYDPVAKGSAERAQWTHLRGLLRAMTEAVAAGQIASLGEPMAEIGRTVDRLVEINKESSREQAEAIRSLHSKAILADAVVGGSTLLLVLLIVVAVVRGIARQRALTEAHIQLLAERNRDLDAFAGRAAHDLQVPLSPIRGYADLIYADPNAGADVKQMAARIRVAVERMSKVIQDMLQLSRAGTPARGQASPKDVVGQVLEEMRTQLAEAKVTIAVTDQPVACTPSLLSQLFRNLIDNAVKFRSADRKLELSLSASDDGEFIAISVADNGIGVSEDDAPRVFEPHFRARSDREVPGYGLGLATVHRAAAALGGDCRLDRSASGGTRITVRLPRANRPAEPATTGKSLDPPPAS